jgi:transcriptional regulator with XRE-family HTH domain
MRQSHVPSSAFPVEDPAKLRGMFGRNLRVLVSSYRSVAALCREIGVNRTQFNRYLSGESFPRPDVLHRICQYFGVDARILLEPVENLAPSVRDLLNHPELEGFFGAEPLDVPEAGFPSGFYRFTRRSFLDASRLVLGLVHIKRLDGYTLLRGFEPREALRLQGLSIAPRARISGPHSAPTGRCHGLGQSPQYPVVFLQLPEPAIVLPPEYLGRVCHANHPRNRFGPAGNTYGL